MGAPGTSPVAPEVQAAIDAGALREPWRRQAVYGRTTRVKVGNDYVPARWAVVDADEVAPVMDKGEGQLSRPNAGRVRCADPGHAREHRLRRVALVAGAGQRSDDA